MIHRFDHLFRVMFYLYVIFLHCASLNFFRSLIWVHELSDHLGSSTFRVVDSKFNLCPIMDLNSHIE